MGEAEPRPPADTPPAGALLVGAPLVTALEARLTAVLGAPVTVTGLSRLAGGASRETWALDATAGGAPTLPLVLRRCRPDARRPGMLLEARTSAAAGAAGVPVPAVVYATDDPADMGGPYLLAARIEGETIARRIFRLLDGEGAAGRAAAARQCGRALARLHGVDASVAAEGTAPRLDPAPGAPERSPAAGPGVVFDQGAERSPAAGPGVDPDQGARGALELRRATIDELGLASPAFELALRWLGDHLPPASEARLVHGDFRVGNLVVGADGLRAVLDWELVHGGDPLEDLGWFCVRAWRFGADRLVAGGLAPVDDLVTAYEEESGRPVDRDTLAWWTAAGTLNWGVICAAQAERHLSGSEPSVELAAIGRRVAENEWDVLECLRSTGWPPAPAGAVLHPPPADAGPVDRSDLHARPSAAELVAAVRDLLEGPLREVTTGPLAWQVRVAANALGIVARELVAGPADRVAHRRLLAGLGVADEAALAAAIRSGALDDRPDEVAAVVTETVRMRLAVDHPGYAGPD